MGRNKLKIQKLESSSGRQVTYSKRRTGIMKKVRELSILCDVDALLLSFSTNGKPTLCLGEKSKFEEVIKRYAQICPQERIKKKFESLEVLKKTFKNTDHVIDIDQLMHQRKKPTEDLKKQIKMLKEQIQETLIWLGPLGDLDNLENIESVDQVIAMEKALNQIVKAAIIQKENFENMLMNHVQFPAQGMNEGLTLNGEPGSSSQFSSFGGPGPLTLLPEFAMASHINSSYFSDFDVPTGGFQLTGTGGSTWFYMVEAPQPLLLEHPFSLPHGDLTSTSNQGSSYSDETEAINNQRQTLPLQYMRTGPSSSQQTMKQSQFFNGNVFADNLWSQNPFIFDQNLFSYDFKMLDFDSWASADQTDIKPSLYNLHQNKQTDRDLI